MEKIPDGRRCSICHRSTLQNSSKDSAKLVSNASLLQDFLICFHINVLVTEVNDLSTSCQFCQTCEQFILEWSTIQTQMTQLTRRAAELKATLSALLLSAPEIQQQNHQDVTEIINNQNQSSQEVELPVFRQKVDDIRNALRRKYSVRVMLEKIPIPSPKKVDPLSVDSDPVDESWDLWQCGEKVQLPFVIKLETPSCDNEIEDGTWDHWELGSDLYKEYMPNEDPLHNGETPEQFFGVIIKTEEETNCEGSNLQDFVDPKEIEVEAVNVKTNGCTKKSEKDPVVVRDGPNRFKYNGYGFKLNDVDRCYYCDTCSRKGSTSIQSALSHIRRHHYTAEDKLKFTAVKTSDTEWLYGGKYKITKMDEEFKCESCGSFKTTLRILVEHIRTQHVDLAPPKKVPCEICGKELSNQHTYLRHVKLHRAASKNCLICNKQFKCERSFKIHMKIHELGDAAMKYQCEYCGKRFLALKGYKDHVRIHTGEMPYECKVCGKKFRRTNMLSWHRRSAHGIKPQSNRVKKVSI